MLGIIKYFTETTKYFIEIIFFKLYFILWFLGLIQDFWALETYSYSQGSINGAYAQVPFKTIWNSQQHLSSLTWWVLKTAGNTHYSQANHIFPYLILNTKN